MNRLCVFKEPHAGKEYTTHSFDPIVFSWKPFHRSLSQKILTASHFLQDITKFEWFVDFITCIHTYIHTYIHIWSVSMLLFWVFLFFTLFFLSFSRTSFSALLSPALLPSDFVIVQCSIFSHIALLCASKHFSLFLDPATQNKNRMDYFLHSLLMCFYV